jgi:hypothetical protein
MKKKTKKTAKEIIIKAIEEKKKTFIQTGSFSTGLGTI